MDVSLQQAVSEVAARYGKDRTRLMDVVREIQARFGCVSREAIDLIAAELKAPRVDVEGVVTFYAFLSKEPLGGIVIRLSECPSCRGPEGHATAHALEQALAIGFGETTPDGKITLEKTACIGLCDQGPAALVGNVPVVRLTPDRVGQLLQSLRGPGQVPAGFAPADSVRKAGEVVLGAGEPGAGLTRALGLAPEQVIAEIKSSKLRGRGGAGFPTGSKWDFARAAPGDRKVVVCNADEGEPGTFKDRVILDRFPERVLEGMAVCGRAIGAAEGILYLRGEYDFLRPRVEKAIEGMRAKKLLGRGFDIRVQMGAGAYVCGEESALLSSCEGRRGVPKNRPPFPVEKGYLGLPTVVNNVETFCCAARIMEKGAAWFAGMGTKESTGTKLFSVSGDCRRPGVYELPFGVTLQAFLSEVGGEGAQAVLVGGPSGSFIPPAGFGRKLGFEDLPTGGSMMVFGPKRDLLEAVSDFMAFFVDESCGYCAPCRVGNVLIRERIDRIRAGKGVTEDLPYLEELCTSVKKMSRCGLGQTSPNPVQTTLASFRGLYEARVKKADGLQPTFDLEEALSGAARAQGRAPVFHDD